MRRRDHEVNPSTHSYVQRRRVPEDTNEIEDTVKKLFHSLNMITHIQTNTLHPYNHISHFRLAKTHHRTPSTHSYVQRRRAPEDTNETRGFDKTYSGKYLITAVHHRVTPQEHVIMMEIVKDSLKD